LTERKYSEARFGTVGTTETLLLAELGDCCRVTREKQKALSSPQRSVLVGSSYYEGLVKAAEIVKNNEETVRVKLKAYRRAKLRKKDLNDLIGLRIAVNDIEAEIDAIFSDNDLYREHLTHSPEATIVYQQHLRRLLTIRDKITSLKGVTDSIATPEPS
jgi:hypothetical protein